MYAGSIDGNLVLVTKYGEHIVKDAFHPDSLGPMVPGPSIEGAGSPCKILKDLPCCISIADNYIVSVISSCPPEPLLSSLGGLQSSHG